MLLNADSYGVPMTYIPTSPRERDAMLATIGVRSLDDLFEDIPEKYRFPTLNQ